MWNEWQIGHLDRHAVAAYVRKQPRIVRGERERDVAHGDGFAERRPEAARRDCANGIASGNPGKQQGTGANGGSRSRPQADAPLGRTRIELPQHHFGAGKSPAASAAAATDLWHCPLKRRFDRRCILSDIRPVKAKASLGPQTVASAEAGKCN